MVEEQTTKPFKVVVLGDESGSMTGGPIAYQIAATPAAMVGMVCPLKPAMIEAPAVA